MIAVQTSFANNSQIAEYRNIEYEKRKISNSVIPFDRYSFSSWIPYFYWNSNSSVCTVNTELLNFLVLNDMIEAYNQISNIIYAYFPKCEIKNELYADSPDQNKKLFIIIKTDFPEEIAFDKLVEMRKREPIFKNKTIKKLISITSESL